MKVGKTVADANMKGPEIWQQGPEAWTKHTGPSCDIATQAPHDVSYFKAPKDSKKHVEEKRYVEHSGKW